MLLRRQEGTAAALLPPNIWGEAPGVGRGAGIVTIILNLRSSMSIIWTKVIKSVGQIQ